MAHYEARLLMEMACSLLDSTPLREDVHALYDLSKERIQDRNFLLDLRLGN